MGLIFWQCLGPKLWGWKESPSTPTPVGEGQSGSRLLAVGRAEQGLDASILEQRAQAWDDAGLRGLHSS